VDLKQLFADVARALQSELVGYVKLEGGSSADVWRLDLSEGDTTRSVVFRQHRAGELKEHEAGIAGKEFRLLGRLSELGLPVARPIHLDEQRRFLITEFVAGSATVDADAVGPAIVQMADCSLASTRSTSRSSATLASLRWRTPSNGFAPAFPRSQRDGNSSRFLTPIR